MFYYAVPKLIKIEREKGNYLSKLKDIKVTKGDSIYSSIEFYADMYVVSIEDLEKTKPEKYPYVLAENESDEGKIMNKVKGMKKLSELDAKELYGTRLKPGYKVKFSQEFGTAFGMNPRRESTKLKLRPSSWYSFGPANLTLGLKEGANVEEYRQACVDIHAFTKNLAKQVKEKKITQDEASRQLEDLIDVLRPDKYVNQVPVEENTVIDNAKGGIPFSIEENPEHPDGVLMYEVSKEIPEKFANIATYDKGEISNDGEFRKLRIKDYFEQLDANIVDNNPENRIKALLKLKDLKGWKLNKLMMNANYQMDELILIKDYKVDNLGFRHMYIRSGTGLIKANGAGKLKLYPGKSYILPANLETVILRNTTPIPEGEEESTMRILFSYKREHLKK